MTIEFLTRYKDLLHAQNDVQVFSIESAHAYQYFTNTFPAVPLMFQGERKVLRHNIFSSDKQLPYTW
jgi:hypothetical protein